MKSLYWQLYCFFCTWEIKTYEVLVMDINGEPVALVSCIEQEVYMPALKMQVHLRKGEPIHTEISGKYSLDEISKLAATTGFEIVEELFDERNFFADSLWRKNG